MAKLTRRGFLAGFGSGILSLGMSKSALANINPYVAQQTDPSGLQIKKHNILGKTGLKVPDVSCGVMRTTNGDVLKYAYEKGVTFFDTAESYQGGNNEILVGNALKNVRDKIVIMTKQRLFGRGFGNPPTFKNKEDIIKKVDNSLKRLQTDYIDIALIHNISDLEKINDIILEAYAQLKKDGKVRFTGFSTHNASQTLQQAQTMDFVDVVLLIYNHEEGKPIKALIQQNQQKGIGIVAMKIFRGEKDGALESFVNSEVSYRQAVIRWVLDNKNIHTCIPSMVTLSNVEEYVSASGTRLNRPDLAVISDYQRQTYHQYCRISCNECASACPYHVEISDILRYAMYFEDYGDQKEAMRKYAELDDRCKPYYCATCTGMCESACPYQLSVRSKLLYAHEMLT